MGIMDNHAFSHGNSIPYKKLTNLTHKINSRASEISATRLWLKNFLGTNGRPCSEMIHFGLLGPLSSTLVTKII